MPGKAVLLALGASSFVIAADRHPVTCIIVKVDGPHRSFVASVAAIPGYMEAMSMPYSVRNAGELASLQSGGYVDFTLVVEKNDSYVEGIRPHRFESLETEPLLARRLQLLDPPALALKQGQPVPNFALTDQTGRHVTLSQFTGKIVAVSFIYTSCPLPNYCFRLSNNFGVLSERFAGSLGRDLILLTITIDPVHDQPKTLAKYAATWKADPNSWHFLTGSLSDVKSVCEEFGLHVWQDEGLLTHALRTVVIDRQGRLAADFEGNEFSAQQLGDFVSAAMAR